MKRWRVLKSKQTTDIEFHHNKRVRALTRAILHIWSSNVHWILWRNIQIRILSFNLQFLLEQKGFQWIWLFLIGFCFLLTNTLSWFVWHNFHRTFSTYLFFNLQEVSPTRSDRLGYSTLPPLARAIWWRLLLFHRFSTEPFGTLSDHTMFVRFFAGVCLHTLRIYLLSPYKRE